MTGVSADDKESFGPSAAAILSTEHWSLLGSRTALLAEAQQRTSVFLTVLSAAIVASALLADVTGFSAGAVALTVVLMSVVLFLGLTTYLRLVQINRDEKLAVLAMNRLRNAYLRMEPALRPYFTASPYDDRRGFETSYSLIAPATNRTKSYFLITTPTVVATIDAAVAAAIAGLLLDRVTTDPVVLVGGGVLAFGLVWSWLFLVQRRMTDPMRDATPRFPSPVPGVER
ncbi:hypothetical protein AB0M20_21500 [Actinoplanes sp. NPDC051633]|uniref:hypothetical protein n=1 Tax=Actinoplanes sp. NPDC051633 TaxID=3155670 RepID=UPI003448D0B7